jgi:endonuclease/exonuclease/phosphatase (EEP) superfamily protein YafD
MSRPAPRDAAESVAPLEIPASPSRGHRSLGRRIATLLGLSALIHPLATLGAKLVWWIDMFTHFYVLAFAVSLAALLAMALGRRYRATAGCLLLAAVQSIPVFRFAGPNPVPPDRGAPRLRILMANVHVENTDYQAIADLIRRERPAVVGLVEVLPHLIDGLEATGIHHEFPYRYVLPVGAQGQAIWFREKPLWVEGPAIFAFEGNPVLRATVSLGGRPVRIWLVHPPNPIGHRGRPRANLDLEALGLAVEEAGGSQAVIGDLNRSEGSPYFAEFRRRSGLRDSRLGFGRQPSWPTWSPYRIAIDHAFLSSDLAVVDRRLGPNIGSDHLPLILDIAPAASGAVAPASTSSANREAHQSSSSGGPAESCENLDRSMARR